MDEVIKSKAYCDGETGIFTRYQIIRYKGILYYIEHKEKECTSFIKLL